MLTVNLYIIVIYEVITVDYCKCILLYSPLNSYLYVHWILDLNKYYYYYFCRDCVGVCGNVCCIAAVVKDRGVYEPWSVEEWCMLV